MSNDTPSTEAGPRTMTTVEGREMYSVTEIRAAFAKYASTDKWGVPFFCEGTMLSALRGEFE